MRQGTHSLERDGEPKKVRAGDRRLFFSVPLSPAWVKVFEKYRDRHGDIPYLRWTPLANLHVTALFLGEVPAVAISEIIRRAREVVSSENVFELTLERVQYAPPAARARMVWAYLEPAPEYVNLVLELSRAMSEVPLGLEDMKARLISEGADILPHITLGRFRNDMPYPRELRRLSRTEREGQTLRVSRLILYETIWRAGHAPMYRRIDTFYLGK